MFIGVCKVVAVGALVALFLPSSVGKADASDAAAYIDTDRVIVRDYMGLGVQWDPNDVWDYTEAQWSRLTRRVDYMRLPWIRCCLMANSYCLGFDAQGNPRYDWNTAHAKRLLRILDYCRQHHVDVMLGEWGAPFGMKWDDPRWSRIIGDCLEYLIKTKGYDCIKYYNKVNEPQGDWSQYLTWLDGQKSLRAELDKRGLSKQVMLVGPDQSGGRGALQWIEYILRQGASTFGAYETHWYASSESEIPNGVLEKVLGEARAMIDARDPDGRKKRYFMGESGTGEWLNGKDSNRYIRDFVYGVFMSDYAAQTMRAGLHGLSAWMLDDPMHQQPGSYPPGGVPEGNPAVDYDFKVWGLWNSMGTAMGKSEDENLRPWYYTWSVMMRSFPKGTSIVAASYRRLEGLRVSCGIVPNGTKSDVSILVVNDSPNARKVRVFLPNAASGANLLEYHYIDSDRPVDEKGFPKPEKTLAAVRLDRGMEVALPARGVVILTTLNGGTPLRLLHGHPIPVTNIAVREPDETVQIGSSLTMIAETDPPGRPVTWSVRNEDATPTDKASIERSGRLTARKPGRVTVMATSGRGNGKVVGEATIDLTTAREMVDKLDDFHKVFEHSGGWAFDTIHNNLFEGDPSRLKRTVDMPEYVVYRFRDIGTFRLKVYSEGNLEGKVAISASSDNRAWVPVEVKQEESVETVGDWMRTLLVPIRLPAGMNYLKIEFHNDKIVWTPQLSEVRISSARQLAK